MPMRDFAEAQQTVLDGWGLEAESRFVTVDGGDAHVLVAGTGAAVVLLNGIGTPAAMWAPLMAELGGFRLHAVDLPGFGLSDTRSTFVDDYRSNAVSFLNQILDELGLENPALVANSLGSLWSSWFAIDRPERVSALVHIGCPALALGTSAPLPMRLLAIPGIGKLMMRLQPPSGRQVNQLARMVREHPLAPETANLLVATERLQHFEEAFLATLNALLRPGGSRPEMALNEAVLRQVGQPVQLIWGRDDPFGSVGVAERVAQVLPNAELHLVDGGHAPWLKHAPAIAAHVVPFLHAHTAELSARVDRTPFPQQIPRQD